MTHEVWTRKLRNWRERLSVGCVLVGLILGNVILSPQAHAQTETSTISTVHWWQTVQNLAEHFGILLIAIIAGIVAYRELRAHRIAAEALARIEEQRRQHEQEAAEKRAELEERRFEAEQTAAEKRAEFEERRFKFEEEGRTKLLSFREEEGKRFAEPGEELAKHIATSLRDHPDWAHHALEAAKLLPYTHTIFRERSQHFREEKQELAKQFVPYLLKRCEKLAEDGRHVFLLIDAGTTLYAFFEVIGEETVKRFHRGDDWLKRFHLVTNNLPGIEQLIKTGRRVSGDRYSGLAIEDCHLLPGIPMPIFAAVAGEETNEAIDNLKKRHQANQGVKQVTFIVLLVGNWVRIRKEAPRCPVAMARGRDHLGVKRALVRAADEIFIVAPLGKIIVNHSRDQLNSALGYVAGARDPESEPYEDVEIDEKAQLVKLVSTKRAAEHLLQRHSNSVEDALTLGSKATLPSDQEFANAAIEDIPHLLFEFGELPPKPFGEFMVEFPHDHTRRNRQFLDMFFVDPSVF